VDPETGHPCRLFNPRIDVWAEHFAWSTDDPTVLIGRTSVGRAPIPRLQMNAPEMLTTRRLLLELGIG
jgi:hypothetical protein